MTRIIIFLLFCITQVHCAGAPDTNDYSSSAQFRPLQQPPEDSLDLLTCILSDISHMPEKTFPGTKQGPSQNTARDFEFCAGDFISPPQTPVTRPVPKPRKKLAPQTVTDTPRKVTVVEHSLPTDEELELASQHYCGALHHAFVTTRPNPSGEMLRPVRYLQEVITQCAAGVYNKTLYNERAAALAACGIILLDKGLLLHSDRMDLFTLTTTLITKANPFVKKELSNAIGTVAFKALCHAGDNIRRAAVAGMQFKQVDDICIDESPWCQLNTERPDSQLFSQLAYMEGYDTREGALLLLAGEVAKRNSYRSTYYSLSVDNVKKFCRENAGDCPDNAGFDDNFSMLEYPFAFLYTDGIIFTHKNCNAETAQALDAHFQRKMELTRRGNYDKKEQRLLDLQEERTHALRQYKTTGVCPIENLYHADCTLALEDAIHDYFFEKLAASTDKTMGPILTEKGTTEQQFHATGRVPQYIIEFAQTKNSPVALQPEPQQPAPQPLPQPQPVAPKPTPQPAVQPLPQPQSVAPKSTPRPTYLPIVEDPCKPLPQSFVPPQPRTFLPTQDPYYALPPKPRQTCVSTLPAPGAVTLSSFPESLQKSISAAKNTGLDHLDRLSHIVAVAKYCRDNDIQVKNQVCFDRIARTSVKFMSDVAARNMIRSDLDCKKVITALRGIK